MGLKNARLARAENLSANKKSELGIEKGLVIVESRNPDLRENIVPITEGGIRAYLQSLDDFKDVDIPE